MSIEGDAQQNERRLHLEITFEGAKLPPLSQCLELLSGKQSFTGESVSAVVESYISYGYPTLPEVVAFLSSSTRHQLLKANDCWIGSDTRCFMFMAGSDVYPDVESVRRVVHEERNERKNQLGEELRSQGIFGGIAFACRMNDYTTSVVKGFVDSGVGEAANIAFLAACSCRWQELVSSFRYKKSIEPAALRRSFSLGSPPLKNIHDIHQAVRSLIKNEKIVSFLMGEPGSMSARFVVDNVEAERTARQCLVDSITQEYRLNLAPGYENRQEEVQLFHFVMDGDGDARQILATIAFDKKLKELSLPDCKALFRSNEKVKDRFNAVSGNSYSCISDLAKALADEQTSRCRALAEKLSNAKRGEFGEKAGSLDPGEIRELERTGYARLGEGSLESTVEHCLKNIRVRRLAKTARIYGQELSSSDFWTLLEFENKTKEEGVTAKLQKEEEERKQQIRSILAIRNMDPDSFFQNTSFHPARLYLSTGIDDLTEVVNNIVTRIRSGQLTETLMNYPDARSHLNDILETPECLDFIESQGPTTCEEIVSNLVGAMRIRKQKVRQILAAHGLKTLRPGGTYRGLRALCDNHVVKSKGVTHWIEEAVIYYARHHRLVTELGRFREMAPALPDAHDVYRWQEELHEKTSHAVRVVVEASLDVITGSITKTSATSIQRIPETGVELSECISQSIQSYCAPSYKDSIHYGLSENPREYDSRLCLLLTRPELCPWKNAQEAVADLEKERAARIELFDSRFGPASHSGELASIRGAPLSWRVHEERLSYRNDNRANYIDGRISLEEAEKAEESKRIEERREIFEVKLLSNALCSSLVNTNQECIDFIQGSEPLSDNEKNLSSLLSKLRTERAERCLVLKNCFSQAGIADFGIGVAIQQKGGLCEFEDTIENQSNGFPDISTVRRTRFQFVDLNLGTPDDVVRATLTFLRSSQLKSVIRSPLPFVHGRNDRMVQSKDCQHFVANTDGGLASRAEIEEFLVAFVEGNPINETPLLGVVDNLGDFAFEHQNRHAWTIGDFFSVGHVRDTYPLWDDNWE